MSNSANTAFIRLRFVVGAVCLLAAPLVADAQGIKGDRLLFLVEIVLGAVIKPAHAKNPAWAAGRVCLSWINRGNGRATIFHKDQDYQAFLSVLALAKARHPLKIFAFSLMPNHFHFVIESSHHQSPKTNLFSGYCSHVNAITSITAAAGMFGRAGLKVFRYNTTNIC